jgi:hypothetical protein
MVAKNTFILPFSFMLALMVATTKRDMGRTPLGVAIHHQEARLLIFQPADDG